MQKLDIWEELEIDKTKEEKQIKAAYYAKLKRVNPEDDPEGFKKLRTAFEAAVEYTKSGDEEIEKDEYDLWIDEVKAVYDNFNRRSNIAEWEQLLDRDICMALDTQDMATERLLVFLLDNYYLPFYVWELIEDTFGISRQRETLIEKFPANFINYVIDEIQNKTNIGFYDFFEGNLENNPDQLILNQSQCLEELYNQLLIKESADRDFSFIHEKLDEIYGMDVSHVYTQAIEEVVALYEKDYEKVKSSFNILIEKLGNTPKPYVKNHLLLKAYALGYEVTGEKVKAYKLHDFLFKKSDILYIISDCIRYFIAIGEDKKAKDMAIEFAEKYTDYPAIMQYMVKANEELLIQYKKEADEGDEESIFEVGWIYFQNEQFDECIEYIKPKVPEAGSKKEYTYNNLLGRCMAQNEQYEEAIPYLMHACELIQIVKEKGAEDKEEERMLKREGLILDTIAMCYREMFYELLENNNPSRENYHAAYGYLSEAIKKIEESVSVETDMRNKTYFQRDKALIYYDNDMYSKCVDICDEILDEVQDWYYIFFLRAKAFYKMDYPQNVIDDFYAITRAIPDNLSNQELYIAPLMTYLDFNRYENADEIFEFAKEHGSKGAIIDLLKLYYEFKQNPDSHELNEISECIESLVNEDNGIRKNEIADLIIYMAYITDEEDYYIKTMEKAKEIYPGCSKLVNWYIGCYYERNEQYENAIMYFEDAIKMTCWREDYESILLRIGKNNWYMDKDDEAYELYMSVYGDNPKNPTVNRHLAEYYLFKYRRDNKDDSIDMALKYINDQFEIYADQEIKRLRAEINLEKYDLKESKKDLLDILDNDPESIMAMRLLEKVYCYEGDFEKAYEIALKKIDFESDDYYLWKYDRYICSSMALRRYDGLEKIITDGINYDREWALNKLIRLYYRGGRFDDIMELAMSLIENAKDSGEKMLGYGNVMEMLCEKGASYNDDAMKKVVNEYLDYIRSNEELTQHGYETLSIFYFEKYGNLKEAIKYLELMQRGKINNYYQIRSNLELATFYGLSGKRFLTKRHFEIFLKAVIDEFGSVENWLREDGYSRTNYYSLGLYHFATKNLTGLQSCVEDMANRVICRNCDKCKCFEYYILKGHLEKLKGNREEAMKAYEIALDSGENVNRLYITRLMKEC
ncbi:MAG: hypothetical protein K6G88_08130 [Lachnospiraceae bacterium]|nr:hypothetical protein [Lachnospiraceae bacterium]